MKKILWAYDGSKEAEEALKVTKYFSNLYGSDIYGLYINHVYYPITPNFVYYAGFIEESAHKKKLLIEKNFSKIKNDLSKNGVKFTGKVIKGDIDSEIKKYAKKINAGLIAVGNTGKDFISRMILGSNTLKVLRNSEIPVLTVPPVKIRGKYKVKKILLPLDISEPNYDSLEYALDIAEKTGSHLTVLYILSLPHNTNEIPPKVMDEIVNGSHNELNKIVAGSKEKIKNLSIVKKMIIGLSPSTRILKYARKNDFDLIVINSNNKGNLARFFLGSVSEDVIRGSVCPVLTIRKKS
ncbi:MAG: universal stress protein [Thermodesulfobacteriota bacterium]